MKTFKRAAAILLSAAFALSLLGCSLKDDPNQIVATVNGAKITKQEFTNMVDQFSSFYAQFGMDPSTDPTLMADVMNSALESLIRDQVLVQKSKELGLDKVTYQEALAAIPDFSPELASYIDKFTEQAKTEGAADVKKRADELLVQTIEDAGMTKADFEKQLISDYQKYKLEQSVKEPVTVTDEEIKAWYDTNLSQQQEDIKNDPTSFESLGGEDSPVLVIPEGYVAVKQVFLKPQDDATVSTKLSDFDTQISEVATKMVDLLKDGKDKNAPEFVELETQLAKLRTDSAAARDAWLAPAKAKADEVYAKAIVAGSDFDALITEYNQDPGMTTEPTKTRGYYVGTKTTAYVTPFKDAALALVNIGDVSPVVTSDMGFHILKLAEKVKPGVVPFETVKEACKAKALTKKQDDAYDAKVKEWVAAAKVEKYDDRLNIPKVEPTAAPAATEAPATNQ